MPDPTDKRVCQTIHSDEFRVELQPDDDGPTLTVSGHAHDPELVLVVRGVDADDGEPVDEARIVVTVEHLAELVECIRKAADHA